MLPAPETRFSLTFRFRSHPSPYKPLTQPPPPRRGKSALHAYALSEVHALNHGGEKRLQKFVAVPETVLGDAELSLIYKYK